MKKLVIIQLIVVLLIATIVATGCAKAGQLPTLKVGNEWVYKYVDEGVESSCAMEVTGEDTVNGKDCYVLKGSCDPPRWGYIDSMAMKVDKGTYCLVKLEMTGTGNGLPFSGVATYSYEFPEVSPWPLEVGKEFKEIMTLTYTATYAGETETGTETETTIYKVEKMEEITTTAGTFECFKVVAYDENGNKIRTSWHSDEVKEDVKSRDHETGDTMELKSYSV